MLTDSVPDFHFHIPLLIGFYTVVDWSEVNSDYWFETSVALLRSWSRRGTRGH